MQNIIGGTTPGTVNVISGNELHGVEIAGSANLPVSKGNIIEKNYIGVTSQGNVLRSALVPRVVKLTRPSDPTFSELMLA